MFSEILILAIQEILTTIWILNMAIKQEFFGDVEQLCIMSSGTLVAAGPLAAKHTYAR